MSLRKRALIAVASGLGISGSGLGLMGLGGWGPCGPASWVAAIGGWLSMCSCIWLAGLVPGLEAFVGRMHADLVFLVLWPAFIWSLGVFVALSLWPKFRRHERTGT